MPIKRNESLQAVSRDHHHGLLLSWKIRKGLKKEVEPIRIKKYVDWFYTTHLLPHFDIEEKYVFTILGNEHELVKKALSEHKSLISLIESETVTIQNLKQIEEELDSHIRFEERILFNEIQFVATERQLEIIKSIHPDEKFIDNEIDPFWL